MLQANFLTTIRDFAPASWDALFAGCNPFAKHAFLLALEESGSVCDDTGWQPLHLVLARDGQNVAVMPLYLKSHSYGEFVFDWAWAEAYRRNGADYYPKLLSAIPFSPVAGPRIGIAEGEDPREILPAVLEAVRALAGQLQASGWHLLFPEPGLQQQWEDSGCAAGMLRREDVQFHWVNHGYDAFDAFLGALRSSRRKNIRRERRRVQAQGVALERLTGAQISSAHWDEFYRCYCATYEKRSGHSGYLNRAFFDQLLQSMRENLLLVSARRADGLVGSALFLFDEQRLYGRYWGAVEPVDCLHFEACFYQGIEFCIERGLQVFDPGTQGEHKLMRGFEPVRTVSYHWLADQRFQAALAGWLRQESRGVSSYEESAREFLPFKRGSTS
jgi:predicted N-acyltransferase